jgi:methylmalonyl-CoA mutase C-terminal domain
VSLLSGAHMTIFPKILQMMKTKGMEDVLLFGGGIIPQKDIQELRSMGVGELFTPGTTTEDIVRYLHTWNMNHQRYSSQSLCT